VYRSTTTGAEALLVTGITGTSYKDASTARGTKYYYLVRAVNSAGTSLSSNEASATAK